MKKTLLLFFLGFAFALPRELKSQDKATSHELNEHHSQSSVGIAAPKKTTWENYYTFSKVKTYNKELAKRFIPEEYWNHPDLGTLPYNAECENCIEEIHKRTVDERFYIDAENPSVFYVEKSATPSNYKINGKWIAINPNLKQIDKNLYAAYNQPFPTEVNIKDGWTSFKAGNKKLRFNQITLIEYDKNFNITTYQPDWSDYTIGDNGVHIYDIFPDIDMTIQFRKDGVKSNFIIKQRKTNVEKLIFRDNLNLPANMTVNINGGTKEEKGWIGEIAINDENDNQYFRYSRIRIRDNSYKKTHSWFGHYKIDSNKIDVMVYSGLLDNDTIVYPLIVDPFVTAGPFAATPNSIASLLSPGICSQTLSVSYPGGSEPQDFSAAWETDASTFGPCCTDIFDCWRCEAEVNITSSCGGRTPTAPLVWKCEADPPCDDPACTTPGLWTPALSFGDDGTGSMISCYTPSCAAQTMTFFFNFNRTYCSDAGGCNCSWLTNVCNALNSWSVTLRGRTMEQPSAPTSSSGTTICEGTSTTLTANGSFGVPPYSYSWSPGGSCSTCQSTVVSPVVTTTYTATITSCGVPASNSITITVNPLPSGATASASPNPVCAGSTLNLTGGASNATSWSWSGPNGFTSSLQSPSIAGITTAGAGVYTLTASNACGSASASTASVTVNSAPTGVTASASPNPICAGSTLNLTGGATGATSWSWTGPNGFTSSLQNPSISGITTAGAGVYTLNAVNSCGSTSASTASVTVNTAPTGVTASASPNPVCTGSTLNLTGGATGATSWSWMGPNGFTSSLQNPSIPGITTAGAGVYTLNAVNSCGSASANTASVTVNTTPTGVTASASPNPVCAGATLTLTGGATGATSWSWTGPNAFTSSLQNPSIAGITTAGAGVYTLNAINSCGSGSASTASVTVNPAPTGVTASASPNPICAGSTLNLTGGATGATSWSWTGPNGFTSSLQNPSIPGITTAGAGVYTLNAVNSCGSTSASTASVTVNTAPTGVTASASPNPVCTGSTLNLTGSATGATGWSWSGPNGFTSSLQNPSVPGITTAGAGVYTLTANNSCGSGSASTASVTVNTAPTGVTASASPNPICAGSTLNLTGGATGATGWSWSGPNGFTSSLQNPSVPGITTAGAGVYTLTASNSCGSASASTASVTVNTAPTGVTASASPNPICAGNTLTLTGGATGATSWSWSGPNAFTSSLQSPTIPGITTAGAGVYTLTASNSCGSTSASTASVTVNTAPTGVTASASPNPICEGATLNLTGGATGATSWSWTGPNAFTSTLQNPAIPGITTSGSGVYTLTASNACGTAAASTAPVTVNPIPSTPTASNNSPLCEGDNLNLTTPFLAGATYSWTGPNAFSSSLQNPAISGVVPANAGVYFVTVTVSGCTSAAGNTTVTVNSLPVINSEASTDATSCSANDGTITITASSGTPPLQYSIDGGSTFSGSGNFTGLSAGSYPVVVTDANGCTVTGSTLIINAPGAPAAPVAGTNATYCAGDPVADLTATGTNIEWFSNPGLTILIGTGSPFAITPAVGTTTYYVTQTVGGCQSPASSVVITVNPVATSVASAVICQGESIFLGGAFQTTAGNYNDTIFGGSSLGCDSVITTALTVNPVATSTATASICQGDSILLGGAFQTTSGNYNDTILGGSSLGCDSVMTTALTVTPAPPAPTAGTNATYCDGDPIAGLTATGTNIEWFSDPGLTISLGTGSPFAISPGIGTTIYYVTQTVSGCQSPPDSVVIIVNPLPVIDSISSTDASTCSANDGTITIFASGGTAPFQYSIDGGSVFSGSGSFTGLSTGNYPVVVTDTNGCIATGNVIITAAGAPAAPVAGTDSTYCAGDLIADLTASGTNIEWFSDPGLTTSLGTGSPFTISPGLGTNIYYVTQTDSGCQSPPDSVVIIVNLNPAAPTAGTNATYCQENPVANLTATGSNIVWFSDPGLTNPVDTGSPFTPVVVVGNNIFYATQTVAGCQSQADSVNINIVAGVIAGFNAVPTTGEVPLEVLFTDTSAGASLWSWNFGDGTATSALQNPTHIYNDAGLFNVVLTVFDPLSVCTDTASVSITAKWGKEIFIPDIFSPNGDGENDVFYIRGKGIKFIYLWIYDRWGELVFESTNIDDGWDGKFRGKEMNAGVFIYRLEVTFFNGDEFLEEGDITLVR